MTVITLIFCGQGIVSAQEIRSDSLIGSLSGKELLLYIASNVEKEDCYKLYPTENIWTHLKLDTRTGQVWQVQYSVNSDSHGEWVVNDMDLTFGSNIIPGRFELYPTHNMYNFLLLDKSTGLVAQIQWSMDEESRGLIRLLTGL